MLKKLKYNKEIELVLMSDQHIGGLTHNAPFLDYAINYIKSSKKRRWIYLGDGIENNLADSPGNVYYDAMSPEQQADTFIDIHKPIRRKCIAYNPYSNHPGRTAKKAGFRIEKYMALGLGISFLSDIVDFIDLTIFENNYLIGYAHGASGGTTPGGRINAQRRFADSHMADIFLMGHLHMYESRFEFKVTPKGNYIPSLKVNNGSYLDYIGSYGQEKNYSASPAHFVSIIFTKNSGVEVKVHYDESKIQWRGAPNKKETYNL